MVKDNFPEDVVGYLKFIDDKYIDDYICLKKLHLSPISNFNNSNEDGDLINDPDEGVVYKYTIPNLSFITCFTEIKTHNLNEDGTLNTVFLNKVLSHDEKRPFIFVSKEELAVLNILLNGINVTNSRYTDTKVNKKANIDNPVTLKAMEDLNKQLDMNPKLHGTSIFTRKIDYSGKPLNKPSDFSLENQGKLGFATKDSKYEGQQEYRIGVVLPKEVSDSEYDTLKNGIDINLGEKINQFAEKFDFKYLESIIFKKDSQGIWEVESL